MSVVTKRVDWAWISITSSSFKIRLKVGRNGGRVLSVTRKIFKVYNHTVNIVLQQFFVM